MAYDGYSRTNDPPTVSNHVDSRLPNPQGYYANGVHSSSREASRERSEYKSSQNQTSNPQPRKPITEAVNTAFHDAHVPEISGDVLAQITQNVIEQLKKSGTFGAQQAPVPPPYRQQQHPLQSSAPQYPPPPPKQPQPPSSPSLHSNNSPPPARNVYTPPSPQKHSEIPDSPDIRNTSIHDNANTMPMSEDKRRPSGASDQNDAKEARPKPMARASSSKEETTLEKIWGSLFEENGKPTKRLSQFLRGLAVHLIKDYEPKHSLVVTPHKMARFYEEVNLPKEMYPWQIVFDDSQSSISRMYRQLRVRHHLIQEDDHLDERPDIPGLTPEGFERWATLMILAHPDEEFERLKAAALNMPINNPDDKKERFPKDISRRLFPKHENLEIRDFLISAMEAHCKITVERTWQEETPTPRAEQTTHHTRRGSDTRSHHSFTDASVTSEPAVPPLPPPKIERERKPYSKVPDEAVIDDTNPTPATPHPIERERKPYSAAPGQGRMYEENDGRTQIPAPGPQHPPPPPPSAPPTAGLRRSTSAASRPINIPPPPPGGPASHRLSTSEFVSSPQVHQNHLTSRDSVRRPPRGHSPSASMGAGDIRRSDGDVRSSFQPSSYEAPSYMPMRDAPPMHIPPMDRSIYEDDSRRYGREADLRRGEYVRGGSPNRKYDAPPERRSTGYSEEDFYRVPSSRRDAGVYR